MRRTSSICRVSHPTTQPAGSSSTASKTPVNNRAQSTDDTDPHDNTDIPRRESLHKPTWQYNIPGQSQPSADAANAPSKGINVTSDSDDEDDEYLRRPSIVKHHHYYQEKEVQQQLQLPTKPLQQLRRASLHSGVCFNKGAKNSSNTKITRHHTIASADLKPSADSTSSPMRRKGSLTHSTQAFGLMMHNSGGLSTTSSNVYNSTATCPNLSRSMDGATFCREAGRALMRMVSLGTQPNVQVAPPTSNTRTYTNGDEEYDIMGKVIMLGDSGVGKTCLLIRFYDGKYMPHYFITTVGIDFRNKVVVVDGTRVKLQIWDTAGQERFRSVTHTYYRDAHALLLLYDVTNKTTYDNIRAWLGEIRDYTQDDVVIVLIGNKADCSNSERQVKREDGERLAREHNVPFMETSAKTGLNVELAFSAVARQLKCRGTVNGDDGKFNVHDYVRDNTQARTMCAQCKSM
ncbi:ras-related protein Rab-26 isoform X1 [Zeugodacus cucurbitae]|uniref:ras-related protein Rab-26 isoform X1 n=1 Tax=Zeugodacus cucurbitae TaxID=28588 RepID=UPI0023D92406|nr:ras-related protein Rab-26 isoform X1 [Zeugodacus cucurbitae]